MLNVNFYIGEADNQLQSKKRENMEKNTDYL